MVLYFNFRQLIQKLLDETYLMTSFLRFMGVLNTSSYGELILNAKFEVRQFDRWFALIPCLLGRGSHSLGSRFA